MLLVLASLGLSSQAAAQPAEDETATALKDLVPPKLLKFEQAPYPPAAKKEGRQGTVVLKLTIQADGGVSKAEVHQAAGHGFDEAAQAAALKFRFDPARQAGVAVPAVILYQYRFTLQQPPEPPKPREPPKPAPGKVRVELSINRVGIAGAYVTLKAPQGFADTQVSDSNGVAEFAEVPPGAYTVEVEAAGYQPYSHAETVSSGRETQVAYRLLPVAEGDEVIIRGEVRRDVTVRKIPQEELALVPGGAGDPIRVIESLPGVARSSDGELIIRGSSPFFNGIFIDGMAIPFLYHIYQVTSVVPADMVDSVTLYPGNYGVRYGRYIGGIVEVGLQSPNTRCTEDYGKPSLRTGCYHGLAQVDFLEGRLAFEGPVPTTKHWSFGVSLRRSWIDYLLKEVVQRSELDLRTAPRYRDDYALVEYNKGDARLSLRAFSTNDEFVAIIPEGTAEDVTQVGRFSFEYGFERLQALYTDKLDDELRMSTMLGVGRDRVRFISDDFDFVQRSHPVAFRHELSSQLSDEVGANGGVDFYAAPYELRVRSRQLNLSDSEDGGEVAGTGQEVTRAKGTDGTFGAYIEVPLQPTDRATIVPGFRVDNTPVFKETRYSPRISARYDLLTNPQQKWLRRTTLKGGAGLHHQAPPVLVRFVDSATNQVSARAKQYSVGFEQEISKHLDLSVEGFYIDRDRLFSLEPNASGGQEVKNQGIGDSVGVETFLRWHDDPDFFGWIAYTLSRTTEKPSRDADRAVADFDQTHNLIILGSYNLGRGWRLGARFRYVTGNPFTDITSAPRAQSLFDGNSGQYQPQFTARNADRLPDVHQLDVRVDKKWQFEDWAFTLYLDVRNTYNHRVVDFFEYNYDFTERQKVSALPVLPILGMKGQF